MRVRSRIAALAASAALAGGVVVTTLPAGAADTTTTFVIAGGALSITAPPTSNLGGASQPSGAASISGPLGNVTVTDTRGGLLPLWTATVSSTDFTTGTATANEKVVKANVSYASGLGTTSGLGVFAPQLGVSLSAAARAANWVGVAGNNSATWNPTMTMTLLPSQVSGTYTGTVTHSVA